MTASLLVMDRGDPLEKHVGFGWFDVGVDPVSPGSQSCLVCFHNVHVLECPVADLVTVPSGIQTPSKNQMDACNTIFSVGIGLTFSGGRSGATSGSC